MPMTMATETPPLIRRARPTPSTPGRTFSRDRLERLLTKWLDADATRRIGDIARAVGVESGTLRNWRRGQTVPDANDVMALADALGVGLFDLYE